MIYATAIQCAERASMAGLCVQFRQIGYNTYVTERRFTLLLADSPEFDRATIARTPDDVERYITAHARQEG